jgi:hypothetical protein
MRATIPAMPAFGDARSRVTAGAAPLVDRIETRRDHCVYRDGERVFCFTTHTRAEHVARALDGTVRHRR